MNFIKGVLAMWLLIVIMVAGCVICYEVCTLLTKFFGDAAGCVIAMFLFLGVCGGIINLKVE
jgi:hypothetical protein